MKPDEPVLLNRNLYDYETESEGVYLTKMKTLIAYMRSKKAEKYGICGILYIQSAGTTIRIKPA
jgi:hypothetical protein